MAISMWLPPFVFVCWWGFLMTTRGVAGPATLAEEEARAAKRLRYSAGPTAECPQERAAHGLACRTRSPRRPPNRLRVSSSSRRAASRRTRSTYLAGVTPVSVAEGAGEVARAHIGARAMASTVCIPAGASITAR